MKIPRFCNLDDTMQGIVFILIGCLVLLNTLNIRLMNLLVFIVAVFLILYGLVGTGWLDRIIAMFQRKR